MAYVALGKFSSALEELIFSLAVYEQWAEEQDGDSGDYGLWFAALTVLKPLHPYAEATIHKLAKEIDPEDASLPESVYGHWLAGENSQGFASVERMGSAEALAARYAELQAEYAAWDSQDAEEQS